MNRVDHIAFHLLAASFFCAHLRSHRAGPDADVFAGAGTEGDRDQTHQRRARIRLLEPAPPLPAGMTGQT